MVNRLHSATSAQLDALLAEQAQVGKCLRSSMLTSGALHARCRAGTVYSPRNGMFVAKETWESLDARQKHLYVARTVLDKCSGVAFCRVTAAFAYGFSFTTTGAFGTDVKTVCIGGTGGANGCSSAGLRRFKLKAEDLWTAEGLPVTSPERTVLDCSKGLAFPDGLAIADSALRLKLVDVDKLERLIENEGTCKGIGRAKTVFSHMNGLAENGGESVLRARIIELGYVEPEPQVPFDNPLDPSKAYRVDLLSTRRDGSKVAIELDGRAKYKDERFTKGRDALDVILDERQREAALSALGLEIMRIRWADLLDTAKLRLILETYRIPKASHSSIS